MKFRTQYNVKPSPPVLLGGEKLVETAGYIPAHKQIERFMQAGIQLKAFREQYDWTGEDEIDEDFSDPTRSGNFDLADATELSRKATDNIRRSQINKDGSKSDTGGSPEPPEVKVQA